MVLRARFLGRSNGECRPPTRHSCRPTYRYSGALGKHRSHTPYHSNEQQDIASYGIARTLGVIDDVKASTSDMTSIHGIHENGSNSINVSTTLGL